MFSKLALVFAASLAVLVAAGGSGDINNSCKTSEIQCCTALHKGDSEEANIVKKMLGVYVPVDAFVGTQCSPLSVVGVGSGSKCASQPVCCSDNKFDGLVAVGCSPVSGI